MNLSPHRKLRRSKSSSKIFSAVKYFRFYQFHPLKYKFFCDSNIYKIHDFTLIQAVLENDLEIELVYKTDAINCLADFITYRYLAIRTSNSDSLVFWIYRNRSDDNKFWREFHAIWRFHISIESTGNHKSIGAICKQVKFNSWHAVPNSTFLGKKL